MKKTKIKNLITVQQWQLEKLWNIIREAIKEEELIVQKIANPEQEESSFGQKVSDLVARFWGSWKFIISFSCFLAIWICFNIWFLNSSQFDPYPFILLNLILSCIAALQAPIIMMSQNRQEQKDRKRSENDYLINLKAEIEVRSLHQKIDLLLQEQIKTLYNTQSQQLEILEKIKHKLKDTSSKKNGKKE